MDDTVKVAKSNLNHRDFRPREVNLAALCRVSIEQVSLVHSTTHHLMFVNLSSIETFVCDEILVSRVLLNLLSNAVKYSPMGGAVRLELNQDEAWVVLRVVDQGLGISETDLPLIFDPFYRSENVNTIGGTGLGLSIVKDCVVRHGGRIRVESVLGRGSTFIVEFPR
ncbi:ATP-binding protein [bacterium]|nr:ATP-binding protein [bacterium]